MAGMALARGEAAPAHILPCMDQHSRGRPLPPGTNPGLSPVPPLLPFPLRAGCPRAPLLYLRVCLCLHGEEEGGWRSVLPQEPGAET